MVWGDLSEKQKEEYKLYCDDKFGKTFSFSESGEPLYFEDNGLIVNNKLIINLLITINNN